jgi:hypothetical protein
MSLIHSKGISGDIHPILSLLRYSDYILYIKIAVILYIKVIAYQEYGNLEI